MIKNKTMKKNMFLNVHRVTRTLFMMCLLFVCTLVNAQSNLNMKKKILFVVTSQPVKGNMGEPTGYYLSEYQGIATGQNSGSDKAVDLAVIEQLQQLEAISILTRYEIKKGQEKKFQKALRKYVKRSVAKPGNIMSEAYYEQDSATILWAIERWSSKEAVEKMQKTSTFKRVKCLSKKKGIQPAKTIVIKDLEPVSKDQWRIAPEAADSPITVMLFVDSKPGTEDRFKELYHTAMPQFRSEPGVINYQLSQLENDSTQFVTYEKFRNEDAFQYHLKFPPIQPVIDYLNTSIKQQPFQTGLHRLMLFAPIKQK